MYAEIEEIEVRLQKSLTESEKKYCRSLIEDTATIIDAYNENASESAKKIVTCNMIIRTLKTMNESIPYGSSQGTVSALGYSQTWTMAGGSTGELYLTKIDKKLLGYNNRLNFVSPFEEE